MLGTAEVLEMQTWSSVLGKFIQPDSLGRLLLRLYQLRAHSSKIY